MRLLILLSAAALALSACGGDEESAANQSAVDRLTARNISANDITAIDAVTAADANMAADMDMNFTAPLGAGNADGKPSRASGQRPGSRPTARPPEPVPSDSAPAAAEDQPAANSE